MLQMEEENKAAVLELAESHDEIEPDLNKLKSTVKLKKDVSSPTDVYPWFEITIQSIDIPTQQWDASIEIHLFWQDITFPMIFPDFELEDFTLDANDVPVKLSEVFENKVYESFEVSPIYKYIPETATIYMKFVMNVRFVERMELQRFPMDRQFLGLDFNGWVQKGNWNWVLIPPAWVPNEFQKPFCVRMVSSIQEYELLSPWIDFSQSIPPLSIRIRVDRIPSFYFGSVILPNFFIVLACFACFPISKDDVGDRLSVTVTLMLTAVAFRFVVTEMLPKVNYLTILDYYLLEGFIMLTLLTFENAAAGASEINDNFRSELDKYVLIILAILWTLTHFWWLWIFFNKNAMRIPWEKMDELDSNEEDEWKYCNLDNVISNNRSKECIEEWNKFRGQTVTVRASVYQQNYPQYSDQTNDNQTKQKKGE